MAGWRIGDRGDRWIRLEADSCLLSAGMVVRTAPGRVSLTTLLRCDRRPAALLWSPLSAVHRHLVPGVLTSAATRLEARSSVGR